jgi:hypothetical protein
MRLGCGLCGVTNFRVEDGANKILRYLRYDASGRTGYKICFFQFAKALLFFHNHRFVPSGPFSPLLAVVL